MASIASFNESFNEALNSYSSEPPMQTRTSMHSRAQLSRLVMCCAAFRLAAACAIASFVIAWSYASAQK